MSKDKSLLVGSKDMEFAGPVSLILVGIFLFLFSSDILSHELIKFGEHPLEQPIIYLVLFVIGYAFGAAIGASTRVTESFFLRAGSN